jgi:uncharacterized membrane protein YdbT with pleckstrin-like domain
MENGIERAIADKHKEHKTGSPNAAKSALEKLPFKLQHDEKIIRELKPQFFGFMMTRGFGSYLGILGFIVVLVAFFIVFRASLTGFLAEVLLLPLLVVFLVVVISLKPLIQYGKSWYWITNHRVIGKRGFIGYSINSIPLENVSDIVLTRTILDRFLGLSSLIIVSMGSSSQIDGGNDDESGQSPNFFPALTEETARELQRVLFNLRDDLKTPKKEEPITVVVQAPKQSPAPAAPQRAGRGATQASIQPRRSSSAKS